MAHQVEVQFQDAEQQKHAAELGMWTFMASEVLFFSGLFALFAAYRAQYGDEFLRAAAHTSMPLGTANTFILLTSSFFVAAAIYAVKAGWPRKRAQWFIGGTILLGVVFLGLKLLEYAEHIREGLSPGPFYANEELPERGAHVFFNLYYVMTGIHALHVTAGIILMTWLFILLRRNRLDREYYTPLELGGIYWHFVDIVWVFLWPLFYLLRR